MAEQPTLVRLSDTDLTVPTDEDIRGRPVLDRHGDDVGDVDDLLVDEEEQHVRLIQVGSGGFLGIGEEKRLIPVESVARVDDAVHIDRSRQDVADSPAYDPELVRDTGPDFYGGLYGYYGHPGFWAPGYVYPAWFTHP